MTEDHQFSTCSHCGRKVEIPVLAELILDEFEENTFLCCDCERKAENGFDWEKAGKA